MKKINSLIGILGALFIVIAYFLMSFNHITSKCIEYNILNLIGGICLAYRVYLDRNYSNFILEIIFIIIAIKSLIL
jgi:uncharacterized membrane-anchored protein